MRRGASARRPTASKSCIALRWDAGRGPVRPGRPAGGSLLGAASESDQGIPEVALQLLPRGYPFGDREREGGGHPFLLFRRVTIGASFDPTDREVSHGAAPGPRAPACGIRPTSIR